MYVRSIVDVVGQYQKLNFQQTKKMNYETDSEDELPGGWEERVSKDGNVIFYNNETKSSQW